MTAETDGSGTDRGLGGNLWIDILGPTRLRVDGVSVPLTHKPVLARLLIVLALGSAKGVSAQFLERETWDGREDAPTARLHTAIRRLKELGLRSCLRHEHPGGRYRLDLSPDRVDAWRLLACAESLSGAEPPSDEALEEALALWRGDPTEGTGLRSALGTGVRAARATLLAERDRRRRPRLLILDDLVGHNIAALFGDYPHTVMTKVEEFWAVADKCDELFDLILVDLHLTEGTGGAEGLAVLQALRRSKVAAILMTHRPREGEPEAVVRRHNLLAYYVKAGNSPGTDFTNLRALVDDLVGADPKEILLPRLDEELARRERKATKLIRLSGGSDIGRRQMRQHVDQIRLMIREQRSVGDIRRAMADFNDRWLPE
ncbi:hypothetical protein [Parafrankia sp. BMG5.11]|uniref:hypothetical protein n=1 Tax=Parafrankia sp. BMG5.11 TaxID=222540 RepID=UPI00103D623B|nr:hypothetical protein [Parafrankia sp. BMG5.11]TCJ33731.1 hypothetical protein E0504_36510 [Parafrankia sp. BMG5.11]